MHGGSGADLLDGGIGADTLQGGSGADTLIFAAWENFSASTATTFTSYDIYDGGNGNVAKGTTEIDKLIINLSEAQLNDPAFMAAFTADLARFQAFITANSNVNTGQAGAALFTFSTINLKVSGIETVSYRLDPRNPDEILLSSNNVSENFTGGVVGSLATVETDGGSGPYSYVVDDARFEVIDGNLKLRPDIALNFEAEQTVTVNVTVTDLEGLTHTETFTVNVTDVNEAPDAGNDVIVAVAENLGAGAAVADITATDPDAGGGNDDANDFEDLTYSITGGNTAGLFTINAATGVITTTGALDYEAAQSHLLTVQVTDGGNLSDTMDVTVNVTDVNEAPVADPNDFDGNVDGVAEAGNNDPNLIYGTLGNDAINAGSGNDTVYGGAGNDRINGQSDTDRIFGGSGNDDISGGNGTDEIFGGSGNDTITGTSDADRIIGGYGDDVLASGRGGHVDTFVFLSANDGNDTINGFGANDRLEFYHLGISLANITSTVVGLDRVVFVNLDGDAATAELTITLVGYTAPLMADDFIFV